MESISDLQVRVDAGSNSLLLSGSVVLTNSLVAARVANLALLTRGEPVLHLVQPAEFAIQPNHGRSPSLVLSPTILDGKAGHLEAAVTVGGRRTRCNRGEAVGRVVDVGVGQRAGRGRRPGRAVGDAAGFHHGAR